MVAIEMVTDVVAEKNRDSLIDQLLQATNGVWDVASVYLGDQLGLYRGLREIEPATAQELANHTGTDKRYIREWLEQQTVSGILEVRNPDPGAADRQFALPAGHAEVLADRDNANFMAPLAQITLGAISPLQALKAAFRTGAGIPYEDYGVDLREGQAGMNRNMFLQQLGGEYLPTISDLDARLRSDPPARVADIGCGLGWSSIGIASAYPKVHVDGFDLDEASIIDADQNVRAAGLENRVAMHWRDAADAALSGRYDLVTAFECIHDLSDPVGVLRTMRRLAGDHGTVLIADERMADEFGGERNDFERLFYGFSFTHCLPVGLVDQPSAGTGTVMRPPTLRRYAEEAGFRAAEILPIDNYFFHFYRLYV